MKVWKAYGSAHSADLSVIGEFETEEDAEFAEQVVEDFVNAWIEERYPDALAFAKAWESRLPAIMGLGPTQADFEMGINDKCLVTRALKTVSVSEITFPNLNGIIKLMLLKDPSQIRIEGRTGP